MAGDTVMAGVTVAGLANDTLAPSPATRPAFRRTRCPRTLSGYRILALARPWLLEAGEGAQGGRW
jgi:hypothetical protein